MAADTPGWPVRLSRGAVTLRPVRRLDAGVWVAIRLRSEAWLSPWEAIPPEVGGSWEARQSRNAWAETVRVTRALAKRGEAVPLAIEYDGRFVGQLTIAGITRGASKSASIGYWVAESAAGIGIGGIAVALALGHAFDTMRLHRVEALVRPENVASRRLLERLGLRVEGTAVRALFVDGEWRDHLLFAITAEEWRHGDFPDTPTRNPW